MTINVVVNVVFRTGGFHLQVLQRSTRFTFFPQRR